jgi:hypothetical protein
MKIRDFINGLPLGFSSVISRKTKKAALLDFLAEVAPVTTNRALVRIGGEGDGGYLTPDDFDGVDTCFSPGVDQTAEFECGMATRGIHCFMADYSVDAAPVKNPLFHFEKKYLGPIDYGVFMTLENWVERNAPEAREMVLQMDIEGAEYAVILQSESALLRRFRIIVVEFHDLQDLWQERGFELIRLTFQKLLKDFEIVHIHPNNKAGALAQQDIQIPPLMEFTFLRKDRVEAKARTETFPHSLDRKNVQSKADFPLPRCWYEAR